MRPRSLRPVVWTTTVVLTLAMSLLAPPPTALAAPILDQQQPSIQPIQGGDTLGGPSHQVVAQVIQAGIAGSLRRVDLPIECNGASALGVEVRGVVSANGRFSPAASVMTSVGHAAGSLPPKDLNGFRPFMFPTPVSFSAGDRFSIVLAATGPTALDSCFIRHAPAGDSYSSGDGWFRNDGQISPFQPGGWLCKCDAGLLSAFDYPFRTYVEVPAPTGADLSITKTLLNPNNLNVFAATEQNYQLMVSNAGPADATAITIVDMLPAGVTLVGADPACTPLPPQNGPVTLTCTLGPTSILPAGGSFAMFIQVKFNNAGSYTNTASVSANEPDPSTANNSSSHTQQVLPTADLLLEEMTAGPGMADPGDTIKYGTTVKNLGPDPASDVTLIQTLPGNTTFISVSSPDTATCGPGPNANEHGCRFSSGIPVGATRSIIVTVTAPLTPQMLTTSATASHNMPPLIFDPTPPEGAPSSETGFHSWVIAESVTQSIAAGGTATTDTEADGATPDDPVEVTVQSPSGGTVTITESENELPSGATTNWTFLGAEVVIAAAAGTTADPLILTFRLDKTVVDDLKALAPGTSQDPLGAPVQVFRNNTSATTPVPAVPDCPMTTTTPVQPVLPLTTDPCVASRTTLSDGDLEIVVYTSQASVWTFAIRDPFQLGGFEASVGTTRKAGSTLPVKFKLFDADSGEIVSEPELQVLRSSPSSRPISCETSVALDDRTPVTLVGGGQHFDPDTNTYSFNWKTDKGWAGTCRELSLQLIDGSEHTALFQFK